MEALKPHSDFFSGRFGSDSWGLPGCNSDFLVCNSNFWPVTLTIEPKSESFHRKIAPESFHRKIAPESFLGGSTVKIISGISKPMVCQTYGLHAGRLSRK